MRTAARLPLLVWAACVPAVTALPALPAAAQDAAPAPELRLRRELALVGSGLGLLLVGELLPVDVLAVPPEGLDPGRIRWGVDRRSLEPVDAGRLVASDWTLAGALALPGLVELALGPRGPGAWSHRLRSGVVYGEALALSSGAVWLGKSLFSRPRPYTYLPAGTVSGDRYDPTRERAFRSMPSGHATLAWTGTATALTVHLLDRPDAPWWERVGVSILGGGLATATSHLRVRTAQHFPSDVLVGSGIGMASGIAVPLLHRDGRPLPSRRAVLETVAGTALGSLVGVLLF